MKNVLALGDEGKTAKFRKIEDIIKVPAMKAKLTNLVDEAVRCKQRIYTEQQTIKDLRDAAKTDVGLNPKQFNAYVAATFNNDYIARRDGFAEMVDLLDAVIGLLPADNTNARDEE
jgi:hypothetical protein